MTKSIEKRRGSQARLIRSCCVVLLVAGCEKPPVESTTGGTKTSAVAALPAFVFFENGRPVDPIKWSGITLPQGPQASTFAELIGKLHLTDVIAAKQVESDPTRYLLEDKAIVKLFLGATDPSSVQWTDSKLVLADGQAIHCAALAQYFAAIRGVTAPQYWENELEAKELSDAVLVLGYNVTQMQTDEASA